MSDSLFDRYVARDAQQKEDKAEEARRKKEQDESERLRLLDTIPELLDRMYERLEVLDMDDQGVIAMIRPMTLESGEIRRSVTWVVGRSEYWRWTFEDDVTDGFFVDTERHFGRSVGANPHQDAPLAPLDLTTLTLKEAQSIVGGIGRVGVRRSELQRR